MVRVLAINSIALLREAAADLADKIHRVDKCVNLDNLLLRIQKIRGKLRCDLLTRDIVLGFDAIHLLLVKASARLVATSSSAPDGMDEDEWIDFVRHYESE